MTSASDESMLRWQTARAARLAALPWLHTDTSGPGAVRYVRDELLVAPGHEASARAVLTELGADASQISSAPAALGFVRLTAPGADVAAASRTLRAQAGDGVAGPHHVFVSSPFEMGGPFGPPTAVGRTALPAGPAPDATIRAVVVDTGIWRDSPLPSGWYEAATGDYDDTLAEHADTGHANFITGVLMTHTDNARVRIVRVLDANGICTEAALADALVALADDDVDLVNLSLGGFSHGDSPPALLSAALARVLENRDRAVVAAAGNEGSAGHPYWPAAFAGTTLPFARKVVAVAAHNGSQVCTWSNTGPWVTLTAPGSDIVSTYVTHASFPSGFARWSGTSFAAPFVVAAIAASRAGVETIAEAVAAVREQAAARSFSGYPGIQ
jgi:thermitase